MADSSTVEEVNGSFEQSGRPENAASSEWESRDGESIGMDCMGTSCAAPQVVVEPSTPSPPATVTAPPRPSPCLSHNPAPEADLPPSYDSLLVTSRRPSQRRSLSGPPPSYASTYRMERKTSGSAGEPGGDAEVSPARRTRKKPCVTLNIEEAFGASRDPWCSLGTLRDPSPAPSLQQQEGEVNQFRSSGGKNVFFYVQDETEEASAARGCDNLGFVPDEKDEGQTEGLTAASDAKPTTSHAHAPEPVTAPTVTKTPATPTPTRRSSNPECLAVPREEMIRSQSFGTELDEAVARPTLRKRSTSRGRPDTSPLDSLAESANREASLTLVSDERTQRHAAHHLQTAGDGVSPSLLRKIFSSPFLGLSRTPSTKSCRSTRGGEDYGKHRSGGQHARPPQGPPSVREDHHRHYMVQHHLYRNSRRNVQEKLHRQLSECDCHHHHHHHLHGRHHPAHHDSADHHHHHHHRGYHHHRSQSTRSSARPRHEQLRRHNTYGHEHYLKFRHDLEERQEADSLEASAGQEEEEEEGEEEHSAVRRVSHYRQEEKGLTDVERYVCVCVGVNTQVGGGQCDSPFKGLSRPTNQDKA
ncbi:hypothetical protein E2C01_036365 [Portunus trituberculatus]|uniref:Uncharacterized protein n=1 Tax=Portunus trituberculatus TaxID=210409 RepID=A0A5B7FB60_PORTR|nr:hypothetical protein [Portunus trituberculatus]